MDDSFYRAQVEHELRAKLLRLRQKAAGMLSDADLLRRLLVDSLSTFCVLFRHALAAARRMTAPLQEAGDHRTRRETHFGIDARPVRKAAGPARRAHQAARLATPVGLLASYLKGISTVIDAVDRLEK